MRQRTKRLPAILLCLAMLGTMFPASAAQRSKTELLPDNSAIAVDGADLPITPETAAGPNVSKPTITAQPKSVTKSPGETAKFTVKATGATAYQWYWRKNSSGSWAESTMTGNTTATLSVPATIARNGYQYRCKVSNSAGYVYTAAVTLTVMAKPSVTAQPKNTTMTLGYTARFTVTASGAASYQWYWRKNSSSGWTRSTMDGNTTASLSVPATEARNGYQYRCKLTNAAGYVYTDTATLTVTPKPVITTQPKSLTKNLNETAKFTVKASGATAYQWYWRKNSSGSWAKSTMTGNKTATLTVPATAARNGYQYYCKVSNSNSYINTKTVTLTVNTEIVITAQPVNVTISEGGTAVFTVTAKNAENYQWYWWKASESAWVKCGGESGKTAALTFTGVEYAWNGYYFCCKLTNSEKTLWTGSAKLTVSGRHVPVITTQPKSASVGEGDEVTISLKAKYADSYQWYWRKNSSSSWNAVNSTSSSITYSGDKVRYSWNGYQFRCKVINSEYSVYSNIVTLTVNPVRYRALLIGQVHYFTVDDLERHGKDADDMKTMLESVNGPMGRSYTATVKKDLSTQQCKDAISSTFAGADDNDVSLFFISTHGSIWFASGDRAGELMMIGENDDEYMTLKELAAALSAVPGSVIVLLGSCGSGAAILENNGPDTGPEQEAELFNEAVIAAFAEAEASFASPNTGEFRSPKFYVMTAAAHEEMSWGDSTLGYGYFAHFIVEGAGSGKPADADGNGTITLSELYDYVSERVYIRGPYSYQGGTYYQHVQVYPENSSYPLFK